MELKDYKKHIEGLAKMNNPPVSQCIALLRQLYVKLEELEWIPVSERLPEEGTYLVLYDDGEQKLIYEACFNNEKWYSITGHGISFTTHWKPIILPKQALKA